MRGAEDAGGYAAEFARSSPCANTDRTWLFTGDVAKNTSERAQALPARLKGDLGNGQVAVAQQRYGPLNAPSQQVPMRRDAKGIFEGSREVRLGNMAHTCQPPDRPVFVRGGIHAVLRAQQTAQ